MRAREAWENPRTRGYMLYSTDGIADLLAGAMFLLAGLQLSSEVAVMPVWLFVLLVPLHLALKRRFTLPRLSEAEVQGYLEQSPATGTIARVALAGLSAIVLAIPVYWMKPWWLPDSSPLLLWLLIAATLMGILLSIGLIYRAPRWAGYALLVPPLLLAAGGLGLGLGAVLAGLGLLMVSGGLLLLGRFLSDHPLRVR